MCCCLFGDVILREKALNAKFSGGRGILGKCSSLNYINTINLLPFSLLLSLSFITILFPVRRPTLTAIILLLNGEIFHTKTRFHFFNRKARSSAWEKICSRYKRHDKLSRIFLSSCHFFGYSLTHQNISFAFISS